ncbi:hypothetical protein QBC35DRAFT_299588 [Podospora australis]|uniref:Uncharacterized protein n=1 Tax=Podospora australis TaxID=1536484 RepID=A0AAN6WPD6_9PEZI|nr:hypothetical protein QBC35DRAFT_299588 [Podospora australis]
MSFSASSKSSSITNTANNMFQLPSSPAPMLAHHHNRDLALQKYFLLQEQQESLRQHLDELRSPQSSFYSTMTNSSASVSPIQVSPSDVISRHQFRSSSIPMVKRSCSLALDGTALAEVAAEEAKLCDVNEGLKRALTELLNCDAVRADRAFRTWVQSRLMDTERELRSGRRRRSAPDA